MTEWLGTRRREKQRAWQPWRGKKKNCGETLEAGGDKYLSLAADKFLGPLNVQALSPTVMDVGARSSRAAPPGHVITFLPLSGSRLVDRRASWLQVPGSEPQVHRPSANLRCVFLEPE